jgi:hypothetical protein
MEGLKNGQIAGSHEVESLNLSRSTGKAKNPTTIRYSQKAKTLSA